MDPTASLEDEDTRHGAELLDLGDAFLELDADWRIVRVNRRQEELSRRPRAETVGRTFAEVWPELATPDSRYWREYDRCMRERVPVQFEAYYAPLDLWTGVTAYPVRTGGIAVFFRDITAIQRAESERARLASIVANTDDAIISKDLDGTIVTWNEAAQLLFGYAATEVIGRPIRLLLPPDRLDEEDRILAELRAGRRVRHFETRRVRKDGTLIDVSVSVSPLRDASGELVGASKIVRDITEQKRVVEALRASEARFRSVFEQAAIGMGRVRFGDARWIDVNEAFCRMLGRPRDEMLATPWPDITHPEDVELDLAPFRRMAAGELDSYTVEKRFVHADGHHVWSKLTLSLVRDASGQPDYEIAIIEDIGDRKRAETALREAEERHRTVLENMAEGLVLFDPAGNITYQNPASLRIHTRQLSGERRRLDHLVVNWSVRRFPEGTVVPPEQWAIPRVLRGERVHNERFFVDCVEDPARSFVGIYNGAPVLDADGRFAYGFLTIEEITEQARVEEAVRASEERWNAAIEHFTEGAIIATEDEQVIYWNPAARALHGFRSEGEGIEPLAKTPETFELWTPDGAHLLDLDEWPMRRIKRGETVHRLELRLRRPGQGWERFVSYSGAMVRTGTGERLIFLSVTDLTEQRQAERALRDADRRKDEFLGMLSHELRNPLAPIRNSLYVLDHAEPTGQQASRAREVVNRQVAHLTRLVDDLLDVTRIARGKVELRRTKLDLAAVGRRTAEDYRALLHEREIDLVVVVPDEPLVVDGDETRLAQVLGNLLSNATKFTPAGGRVTLAVSEEGPRALVHVRDTGVGIPPDLLPTIFDPFTQAKQNLARSEGGLGLGLALVKGLTELHGGRVTVSSTPGSGTEFTVDLPVAQQAREPARRAAASHRRTRANRVLVVDDNADAAESLAELVRMFGHEVEVAYDGRSAVASVAANRPDVVLCDIGLPGMDGYEVARALRAQLDGNVQLIAVSGYAQPEDVKRSIDAGFDAHIAKPADPVLIERLFADENAKA